MKHVQLQFSGIFFLQIFLVSFQCFANFVSNLLLFIQILTIRIQRDYTFLNMTNLLSIKNLLKSIQFDLPLPEETLL